ncbi:hypothetical protein GCM10010964_32460 [Caldovatus sediminis]|uniref:Uncharacterized protein n=1 Tax=Caldovatus sediminis TaxID=2041189 RepID=A0A8J3EC15_9PROT|nr:hypothetical protein GCM10010964_32460 [Caldovatus sediminis]
MRVDGFEVSATGRIPENRNLIADYTRLESEIVRSKNRAEAGRQFADVAPDTLSPRTTCNLPHGVQIGGGAPSWTVATATRPTRSECQAISATTPPSPGRGDGPMRGLRFRRKALNLGDAPMPDGRERGSARQTAGEGRCGERGRAERRCPLRRLPCC